MRSIRKYKQALIAAALFLLLMALLPLLAVRGAQPDGSAASIRPSVSVSPTQMDSFTILDEATGKMLSVRDDVFLYGAVVCEMPLSYADEALKAQAIAAYTVYDYKRAQRRASGKDGPDFTCNTERWLLYTTEEQMKARWGDAYPTYRARLESVLTGLAGKRLTYNGERVLATYYAISSGVTEASADVWGGAEAYLVPVDSNWDTSAPGYASEVTVMPDELQRLLLAENPSCHFAGEPAKWIGAAAVTSSGTVQHIELGGISFSGETIRTLFQLRSAHFTVTYLSDGFHFSVLGYGHDVGMSQYGADCMAKSGSTFDEILNHYYPGTIIQREF